MSIYDMIKNALTPLAIPVFPLFYAGQEKTYAVIHQLTSYPAQSADDREQVTAYLMQVDLVSNTDIQELVETATNLLTDAGFSRRSRHDEYDEKLGMYRFIIRAAYFEEV